MITEIIDLLVDASNTFGSLCTYLRMKYKNYGTIINEQTPIGSDKVEQLYVVFPKLINIKLYISLLIIIVLKMGM